MKKLMTVLLGVLMMTQAVAQGEEIAKRYVTWDEIREIVFEMCEEIDNDEVDVICGISVGGLAPTSLFSLELKEKNVVSISCRSYDGYEQGEVVIKNGPERSALAGKKVLLVDDIVDSGNTIVKVKEHLYEHYGVESVDVAVIYLNTAHCKCEPPAYWGKETTEWIVFPWEVPYSEVVR